MGKAAFLTGASGFVGTVLARQLAAAGWRITAIHRPGSNLKYLQGMPIEWRPGDVTDRNSLIAALPEGVDAVYHLAGDTSLWSRNNARQTRINVEGTRNMVEAALARNAGRFVHTSSISVYGLQAGVIDERAQQLGRVSPVNYQKSKYLAEEEVRKGIARGLDAVILNPAAIMGPYDTVNWVRMIRLVCAGKLPGVPPGRMSFCHVDEVARAHIAAFDRGRKGENYLLGGTDAPLAELVREIGEVAGVAPPTRVTPAWLLRAVGQASEWASLVTGREPRFTPESARMATRHLHCDCGKAVRELGFQPVPLRKLVEDSYAWLEAERLI
ncbi:MAG: SDR family oxidoreductase [Betaproteobacteria bacterium]